MRLKVIIFLSVSTFLCVDLYGDLEQKLKGFDKRLQGLQDALEKEKGTKKIKKSVSEEFAELFAMLEEPKAKPAATSDQIRLAFATVDQLARMWHEKPAVYRATRV